jgi:hypothetical protein
MAGLSALRTQTSKYAPWSYGSWTRRVRETGEGDQFREVFL